MEVRHAAAGDAPSIASLAGELGYPCEIAPMRARLEPLLRSEDDAVFVAVSGVAVVGWAHVAAVHLVESESYAELRGLVVAEALRSRGFGERLLGAAEEWARSRGFARIRVRSNTLRERTHRFYERHGYTTTKSQKVFDKRLG
ncbi:MAG TPA: GNAT family N-acetyltransferase [Thermoanaerobaculia bacterium]|jgi:GNAT superfamily N-acetyltransferase|nr:GNAT family N-acetyltransferase [Thermoanaerobaculia bacterium]